MKNEQEEKEHNNDKRREHRAIKIVCRPDVTKCMWS